MDCVRTWSHSRVLVFDRKTHEDHVKNKGCNDNDFSLDRDGMRISSNDGAGLSDVSNTEIDESDASGASRSRRRPRKLIWKDELLVCCFCAK